MEDVPLFQEPVEKFLILILVDLGGGGQRAAGQQIIKVRQGLWVPSHIVGVGGSLHLIGVKQHGNIPPGHIGVGQIHRGFTGQNK